MRGILYLTWGDAANDALARSRASALAHHPELPHHCAWLPHGTLLSKARMLDLSPFDETLFLDADTVVMDRLDYGFEKAAKHGMALCINECPWARRYTGLADRGDMLEYNTGVVFFTRAAKPLFDAWVRSTIDSSIVFRGPNGLSRMPENDQGGFADAMESTGFNPWILPHNWNFRPIWHTSMFGPVKIWHDYSDVPKGLRDWNAAQLKPDAIIDYARLA